MDITTSRSTGVIDRPAPDDEARFYDPTGEAAERSFAPAPRVTSIAGTTIALLDNGKLDADRFLGHLATVLREEHGVAATVGDRKETTALPAPADQLTALGGQASALIVAMGDCGSCSATSVMDAIAAERLGIPAVPIVTDAFRAGAEMVAMLHGAPGYPAAFVAHPIATVDDEGLRTRARVAANEIVRILEGQ